MFSVLHVRIAASSFLFRAIGCVTLPSACFHRVLRYYDGVRLPDIHWNILQLLRRLILSTLSGYVRISAVPITHLRESLSTSSSASPCSQTGGLDVLTFNRHFGVVCCYVYGIDQFPLNSDFAAQSLHFRYGFAAPFPPLRAYVTSSFPRTRYGRTAAPYPAGLFCYDVISLQRALAQSVENSLCCFQSSHIILLLHKIY